MEDFLFLNTRLEKGSLEKDKYGFLERENGVYYFKPVSYTHLDVYRDSIIRSDIVDAEVLDAAKELKIVVRAGAGYDNADLAAATAHNVCVMNTPGQNSNAVAELALGMMVYAVRNFCLLYTSRCV